jgi:hypothetical protein
MFCGRQLPSVFRVCAIRKELVLPGLVGGKLGGAMKGIYRWCSEAK